ncbi:Imm32 family immunity protein [Thalassotalea mangrovi]|uniref:Uncharacterized protein n=1 Tax=Thalassotalea mangrovi TaxID=2572245 RepID=A0A4V5NU85_9GAMM|nr:hypothetical protein [Thalassotalea mangrovi]TKB45295.1 hypothetical protein E8M12_08815 [Thalassotalea mangrovi]
MDKLSGKLAELTSNEWRELGFFYTINETQSEWVLTGSKLGLKNFSDLLHQFSLKEESHGDHFHIEPHWYLTLTSSDEPMIDKRGVWGRPSDFSALAKLISDKLEISSPNDSIVIKNEYAPKAEYSLVIHVKKQDFDPATLDPQL